MLFHEMLRYTERKLLFDDLELSIQLQMMPIQMAPTFLLRHLTTQQSFQPEHAYRISLSYQSIYLRRRMGHYYLLQRPGMYFHKSMRRRQPSQSYLYI